MVLGLSSHYGSNGKVSIRFSPDLTNSERVRKTIIPGRTLNSDQQIKNQVLIKVK